MEMTDRGFTVLHAAACISGPHFFLPSELNIFLYGIYILLN